MSLNVSISSASKQPSRRLLLIKFGAIGDVIMTLPAARALHQAGYQVDWACGTAVAPLLHLYPWINVLPVDDARLLRGSKQQRVGAILRFWRRFYPSHYDLCATLYYDSRYRLLTLPLRATRKFQLSHTDRAARLLPGRHHADEYARILFEQSDPTRIDGETPTQLAPIPISGLPPNPLPLAAGTTRIVMVAAGARNAMRDDALRRWPLENYVELAATLLQCGYEVVLAGGPDDSWASPAFSALAVTDVTGKLSLLQMLALLDSATVTITHDTGPLHLAGVTSTAIISIFGPTDPRGRLPQRANCVALWGGEGFACRPCYDGRDYAPCTHNGCMTQVTCAMVMEEVETLLTATRSGKSLLPRVVTPPHTPLVEIAAAPGDPQ